MNQKIERKSAFTLAEVTIVLMILGIIAIIVIPSLINNYREHTTVSKVKKVYSQLNQAYLMSIAYNGPPSQWNLENGTSAAAARKIAQYIIPYMNITKDCETASRCLKYPEDVKTLSGGTAPYNLNAGYYYKVIIIDNSYLIFANTKNHCTGSIGGYTNSCAQIFFDINGNNLPNAFGKDIFAVTLTSEGLKPNKSNDCTKFNPGNGCLNYIIKNNNMNYLH